MIRSASRCNCKPPCRRSTVTTTKTEGRDANTVTHVLGVRAFGTQLLCEQVIGRVAEAHPKVMAYVKNHNLGLEVPYRYASETRKYRPDFIVQVDDGKGAENPLNLIVEIKGYRGEDAKEKKSTMDTYWVPGVNSLVIYGRWAFVEFTEVYQIESDFKEKVESKFNKMIETMSADQGQKDEMEA